MVRNAGIQAVVLMALLLPDTGSAQTQQTPSLTPSPADSLMIRSPRGAIRRAVFVPGWGQIYNHQYVKLPFLYAGMGVLLVSAFSAGSEYGRYRRAFLYKAFQERLDSGLIEANPHADLQQDYDRIAQQLPGIASASLERHRDNLRRNRDLSILGVGAIWALGVLDAYVSAHMSDFDVGEDLSIRVAPVMASAGARAIGVAGARVRPGFRVSMRW